MADVVALIRVFISSPGDVMPEREAARQVLERLNQSPGLRERYKLVTYTWEDGAPALIGRAPQDIVDTYLLDPADADLMVCVLWQRMGSPLERIDPATGRPYQSGTEYEFLSAYRAFQSRGWPLLLLYRCERPAEGAFDAEQVTRVQRFFARFEIGGDLRGLVGRFQDRASFAERLARDLELLLNRDIPQVLRTRDLARRDTYQQQLRELEHNAALYKHDAAALLAAEDLRLKLAALAARIHAPDKAASAPEHATLVLLAPLHASADVASRLDRRIRAALQAQIARLPAEHAIRLEILDRPLLVQREARSSGVERSARLVIWGGQDLDGLCLRIEILRTPAGGSASPLYGLPLAAPAFAQADIGHFEPHHLRDGLVAIVEHLAALAIGILLCVDGHLAAAEALLTAALGWPAALTGIDQCAAFSWRGLARAARASHTAAQDDFTHALELCPEPAVRVQRGLSALAAGAGAAASADFEHALADLPAHDAAGRAALLSHLGLALQLQGRHGDAERQYQAAEAAAAHSSDLATQALLALRLGSLAMLQKSPARAFNKYQDGLRIIRRLDDPAAEAFALAEIGRAAHAQRLLGVAILYCQQALAVGEAFVAPLDQGNLQLRLGIAYLSSGAAAAARAQCEQALVLFTALGDQALQARARRCIALADARGQPI